MLEGVFLKDQWRRPVTGLTAIFIIVVVLIAVFYTAIDRQLHHWKLLPNPQRLTELYFTHPNALPASYLPGQTLSVAFTVHNLEYQTTDYHYTITESNQNGAQAQILATGSFNLAQNQYHKINVNIPTIDDGNRAKVEVTLVNIHESIDFWVNEGAHG